MSSYQTVLHNETYVHAVEEDCAEVPFRFDRTDNQLVDLVLAGDETAFEQIFDRHKRLVAVIANRYFRRYEEVEEIIQISFAKAYTELGSFRGNHDRSLASWIARITANSCFDQLRRQRRKPERLTCDLSEHEVTSLMEISADNTLTAERSVQNQDLIEKLLGRLPAEDRALLQMLYAEEMSTADIAELLGISASNVKIRAWRARGALRKVLGKFL